MKAEYGELKNGYGEIRLFPESIDDLWHLRHLIGTGDLVFATTFRSVDAATDKIRPEKVEKRPVRLGVRVERVEFSEHVFSASSNMALMSGPIIPSMSRPGLKSP
jgi:protein pelota